MSKRCDKKCGEHAGLLFRSSKLLSLLLFKFFIKSVPPGIVVPQTTMKGTKKCDTCA